MEGISWFATRKTKLNNNGAAPEVEVPFQTEQILLAI
jgi:hypothetical protein